MRYYDLEIKSQLKKHLKMKETFLSLDDFQETMSRQGRIFPLLDNIRGKIFVVKIYI